MLEAGTPSRDMEKRIFIAVLISIGFLWLWAYAAPKLFPELARKPVPVEQKQKGTTTATAATAAPTTTNGAVQPSSASAAQPAAAPTTSAVVVTAPVAASQIVETEVKGENYIARFSNRGAELVSFRLAKYTAHDGTPVELVKARKPESDDYPFAIQTTDEALAKRINTARY